MLADGLSVEAADSGGWRLLHLAARDNAGDVAQLLLVRRGARRGVRPRARAARGALFYRAVLASRLTRRAAARSLAAQTQTQGPTCVPRARGHSVVRRRRRGRRLRWR